MKLVVASSPGGLFGAGLRSGSFGAGLRSGSFASAVLSALFTAIPLTTLAVAVPPSLAADEASKRSYVPQADELRKRAAVPRAAMDRYQSGKQLGRQQKYREAITEFDAALKIAPNMVDAIVDRASAYMQLKEFDKAIAGYNQALDLNPNILRAYSFRGYCHAMKKEFAGAVKDYTATLRLDPEDAQAYFNRAKAYEKLGMGINAARDRATMKKLHLSLDVRDKLAGGRSFLNQGSLQSAVRCLDIAIKEEPANAKAYFYRARAYLALQQYEKAVADCDKVDLLIAARPKGAVPAADALSVDAMAAEAKFELGRLNEALKDATSHLRRNPQDVHILTLRARILEGMQSYAEAIKDYSRAIDIDPKNSLTYKSRASLEERMGKPESAERDLKKALNLSPQDDGILYELYAFHFRGKQYKQAVDDCNLLIGINSKDAEAYRMRAEARVYLKDYESAIADYCQAIEMDPSNAWRLLNARARLYELTGRKDLAAKDRDQAARLNPASRPGQSSRR